MLDTITLRLHDLQKNHQFVNALLRYDTGTLVSESQINRKENQTFLNIKYLDFLNEQKTMIIYKGTFYEPSSNYNLTYFINSKNDYIEFSFSIPKFLYGHNIAQFVPHANESRYNFIKYKNDLFEGNVRDVYKRLTVFIESFFNWLYPSCFSMNVISRTDIEINRLDFCFNQFFDTKEDALKYLQYQKRLKKNFTRENNKGAQTYETSIFYNTDRYSVKIYHKGTEYQKKDKKQHEKINNEARVKGERSPFNIAELSNVADKILRYELTTRKTFMSYLYRTKIYLVNDKFWILYKKNYLLMRSINQKFENACKKKDETKIALILKLKYKQDKFIRQSADVYEKVTNKDVRFFMNIKRNHFLMNQSFEESINLRTKNLTNIDFVKFDFEIFNLLYLKFKEFYFDFQIQEKVFLNDFVNRVKSYNEKQSYIKKHVPELKAKKINASGLNQFVLLLETYTMDEIRSMSIFSERTFFYYKSKLKKLELYKQNVMDYEIRKCNDFSHYHNWHFRTDYTNLCKNLFFK